jgi:hypothetical protein
LEVVGVVGGYGVIYFLALDEEVRLVTNLHSFGSKARELDGRPRDLIEFRDNSPDIVSVVSEQLQAISFGDGVEGTLSTWDGAAVFLTVKAGKRTMRSAQYGYSYPAFWGSAGYVDEEMSERRASANSVFELWRGLMARPTMEVDRVIAGR